MKHPPHILVVAVEPNGWRRYTVRCPGVTDECRGWLECREPGCTASEDDDAHGVEHRYVEEVGYSVAVQPDECWLTGHDDLGEMARWALGGGLPTAGEYPFHPGWDRYGDAELRLVEVAHAVH